MLRIILNNGVSEFTIEKSDPININSLILKVKRSEQYDGVTFEVVVNLQFIKEAIPYIKNAFLTRGGIDAQVQVTIMEFNPNRYVWEEYQRGKINFNDYSFNNTTLSVTVEQVSDQSLVLNALSTDVALYYSTNVSLHSKKLLRQYTDIADILAPTELLHLTTLGKYYNLFESVINKDEIEESFHYPNQLVIGNPMTSLKYKFRVKESGEYVFDFSMHTTYRIDGASPAWQVGDTFRYLLTYGKPGGYTTIVLNSFVFAAGGTDVEISFNSTQTLSLLVSDEIYIYPDMDVSTNNFYVIFPFLISDTSQISTIAIDALTQTDPSHCIGLPLFEAVQQCLNSVTNNKVILRSTLLDRTDLGASEDGDASLILWTNGNYIRNLNTKQLFGNLSQILGFLNAGFCIGFGFEMENNVTYMRVERKSYFFDKTTEVVRLADIYEFTTKLLSDKYYKTINYGYSGKLELRQINATDDFNTLRSLNMPIKNSKGVLDITTNVRANGSEIEYQRRLIGLSEDSNLDDQNFVIVLVRDGDDYKAKKMEGYDAVSGVYDAATGYNYDISPARMLLNWYEYLASNVIYSLIKSASFASGTGNYQATTTKTGEEPLAEDGTVDLSLALPIFDCFSYQLTGVPFTRSEMNLIKANPFGYNSFRDKDNVVRYGFLNSDGIDHDSNNNRANITLLKLA